MTIAETFNIGLEVTLYGMGGVFVVLILFYILTKLMVRITGGKQVN
jgi:Na+-transporting methylmalonyl-CoA/oxaloacetate decarboxylase gamma subunit